MARPFQSDFLEALAPKPRARSDSQDSTPSDAPLPPYRPNLDDVRRRLERILSEARSAQALPWDAEKLSIYRAIVPHMTTWLPEEEGTQLRSEFETELARLQVA